MPPLGRLSWVWPVLDIQASDDHCLCQGQVLLLLCQPPGQLQEAVALKVGTGG